MKKTKKKNLEWIYPILLVGLIFFLVIVIFNIGGNIRTIDLVYNTINLGNALNITITDLGSDLIERPMQDYYIINMNGLKRNILTSIILSMLITYLIMEIYNETKTIKK